MRLLDSLRRRLVVGMLLVFAFGVGGAIFAWPFEGKGPLLNHFDVNWVEDPYQDVLVLLVFTAAAIFIIVLISGWTLRHLREAALDAARVGPRNPEARIAIDRLPREIRPLVSAVNAALERMARAYDAERRFVADAAHELRTPLTVLSLRLQQAHLSGTPNWGQIEQDVVQMTRVVSQLLDLARKEIAEADDQVGLDVVDVGRAAREAAALILPLADAAQRSVELDLPERLPVRGRAGDLQDMLRNLLENAVVHGEGRIRVVGLLFGRNDEPSQVAITVSDQGSKLALVNRDRLFDRFRKVDAASNGSGLGLAIVREVVRAHGGTVQFVPGPETVVQVLLPAFEG
jgi:two-component system sensor histidine kinase QseC